MKSNENIVKFIVFRVLAHTPKVSSIASGISYFRGLHAGVTERFTRLCQEWEEKSNALEQEYGSDNATDGEGIAIEDGRKTQPCPFACVLTVSSSL